MIADVQSEQGGVFRPLSEDPVIAAASLPLGGTGTLVLLERLLRYLQSPVRPVPDVAAGRHRPLALAYFVSADTSDGA